MNRRTTRPDGGFTLVEILVVLAVTGIVTAGLFNFMISQERNYSLTEDLQERNQNVRVAMDYFVRRLQGADQVRITGLKGGECKPEIPILVLDGQTYYFKFRTGDATRDLDSESIGTGTTDVAYFLQDVDGDNQPDQPVFQCDPTDRKIVIVTIIGRTRHRDPRYQQNGGYHTMVLTRKVYLRNATCS